MREVIPERLTWWTNGDAVGSATVVATFQSAPRPAGASMLVGPDGSAVGSVSGGCIEGAVHDLARSVVGSGSPVALPTLVEHPEEGMLGRRIAIRPGRTTLGCIGSARADQAAHDHATGLLAAGTNATLTYGRRR